MYHSQTIKIAEFAHKLINNKIRNRPATIVDMGVGIGAFGNYYFYHEMESKVKRARDSKKISSVADLFKYDSSVDTELIAVDIDEDNIENNPLLPLFYTNVYCESAMEYFNKTHIDHDLVVLTEMLEHVSFEVGVEILKASIDSADNVIVSTPSYFYSGKRAMETMHDEHKSFYNAKFFIDLGFTPLNILGESDSQCYII